MLRGERDRPSAMPAGSDIGTQVACGEKFVTSSSGSAGRYAAAAFDAGEKSLANKTFLNRTRVQASFGFVSHLAGIH